MSSSIKEEEYSADEIKRIKSVVAQYHATEFVSPTFYLISNIVCILAILYLIVYTKKQKTWFVIASILLLALFMMRMFMMFHDMCHKSYFPSTERQTTIDGVNVFVAQCIEGFNLFEASHWNKIHSAHHKAQGNMNLFDHTRTVLSSSEYDKLPQYQRVLYDVFRNPIIFFPIAPLYIYWICKFINQEWMMLFKYIVCLVLLYLVGSYKLLFSFLAAQYIAATAGLMLFHLQHQVNIGYWRRFPEEDELSKDNAELRGSSVLKIPWVLDYFTNGIEYHNVHHIDPGVPSYKIRACYEDLVSQGMLPDNKVGYLQALKSLFHVIYNEKTQRYESGSFFRLLGLQG